MKRTLLVLLLTPITILSFVIISHAQYTITQLTTNAYDWCDPHINNNGYVVWVGSDGSDTEIFLYNGTSTTQLTNNAYSEGHPQINDNGYVVWVGDDGFDTEIFLLYCIFGAYPTGLR